MTCEAGKPVKSIKVSPEHGDKLDLICRAERRKITQQVELLIDMAFDAMGLSMETEADQTAAA